MSEDVTLESLPSSLRQVVEEVGQLSDTRTRLAQLLEWGKQLPALPEQETSEATRVPGCVSEVHIRATLEDGVVVFQGDADALLIKGMVALLARGLSGLAPQEIAAIPPDFLQLTGIKQSLVPSRMNGFRNIFLKMQEQATQLG